MVFCPELHSKDLGTERALSGLAVLLRQLVPDFYEENHKLVICYLYQSKSRLRSVQELLEFRNSGPEEKKKMQQTTTQTSKKNPKTNKQKAPRLLS